MREKTKLRQSDWSQAIEGKFDFIVSNPPYLTDEEFQNIQDEIRSFEPSSALVSGNNCLCDLFLIVSTAGKVLSKDDILTLETGNSQHESIANFAKDYVSNFGSIRDLCKQDRSIILPN
jgi:release factor glutamine methyltransferase